MGSGVKHYFLSVLCNTVNCVTSNNVINCGMFRELDTKK